MHINNQACIFFLMTSSYQLPSSHPSLPSFFTLLYISVTLSPSPVSNYHSSVIMHLHLVSICLLISFLAFSSSHSPSSSLVAPGGTKRRGLDNISVMQHKAETVQSKSQPIISFLMQFCLFSTSTPLGMMRFAPNA